MSSQVRIEKRSWLSRTELQLELGRLALRLARAREGLRPHARATPRCPRSMIDWFLEAGVRVLQKAQPAHRRYVIDRLTSLAEAFDLKIIGLETWLLEQMTSWRRRCDRLALPDTRSGPALGPQR